MFDASDPRAALAPASTAAAPTIVGDFRAADYVLFHDRPPNVEEPGLRQWIARGCNFLVAHAEGDADAVLAREDQPDEYALLLPDAAMEAEVAAGGERVVVPGHSLVIIPPGPSRVTLRRAGRAVRVMTTRSADLAGLAVNAASYATRPARIPPLADWPAPPGGFRVRRYSLDVPPTPGRFGRIFRCTTLMVNVLDRDLRPRDAAKMSPHHHDDFEQGSLVLEGAYTHHLRWPWIPDMTQWREDEHVRCGAPSLTVIPPPAVHTTRAEAEGQMVDLFCPPRRDFSAKPGWVLNADDYPTPN
jgi:hypothetical protein